MGFKFSLVLSREITDDESAVLQEAGCAGAVFATGSLPTNAEVAVTKMDFDDTLSSSLAAAIESALEAVKKVPDLGVPGLNVPAQPAGEPDGEAAREPVAATKVVAGVVVDEAPSEKKGTARKPAAKKAASKKPAAKKENAADSAPDPVEVAAGSD